MSAKHPYEKLTKLATIVKQDANGTDAVNEIVQLEVIRPKTRADCLPGGSNECRPCPWYGCKYHLGLDINENGSMSVRDIDDMAHTCDLDVAEIGTQPGTGHGTGITLEEVGEILDLTRERARQLEVRGLIKLKPNMKTAGLAPDGKLQQHLNGHSTGIFTVYVPVKPDEE